MNRPKQGYRERDGPRFACEPSFQRRQPQSAQQKAEKHKRNRNVKKEVDHMVSHDVGSAQGIVDCQGQVDHWSSVRTGRSQRRKHGLRDGPQVPDGRILDDGRDVVEDKGTGEAIVIGGKRRGNDEKRAERDCQGRLANQSLSLGHRLGAGMRLVKHHFRRRTISALVRRHRAICARATARAPR